MKTTFLRNLKAIFALFSLVCFMNLSAAYVEVDGINYEVKKFRGKWTASVRPAASGKTYSGEIVIPADVDYKDAKEGALKVPVLSVATNAFANQTEVTKVTLPECCTTIGTKAFQNCTGLTNFPAVEGTIKIGAGAFQNCPLIKEAFLPAGCVSNYANGEFAFGGVLTKFEIRDKDASITKDTNLSPKAFAAAKTNGEGEDKGTFETLVLNRKLGVLYPSPFKGMKNLKKIVLGTAITATTSEQFANCTDLQTVEFAEGSTFNSFGNYTFQNCTSLVALPIPAAVTSIPSSLCYNCNALASLTLPEGITEIGSYAFANTKLANVVLPSTLTSIYEGAFMNGMATENLVINPAVTYIGPKAFFECAIKNITLPVDVKLGTAAIALCDIDKIQLDGQMTDPATSLSVSEGGKILVTADGKRILFCCPSYNGELKTTTAEVIEDYAFANAQLTGFTAANLKSAGFRAFMNTKSLKEFTLLPGVAYGTNLLEGSGLVKLIVTDGITVLPVSTCENCTALTEAVLPEGMNVIMRNAFAGCTGLKTMEFGAYLNYMESGAVPETIESIVCRNVNVPVVNEEVFTEAQSAVVCKVAESAVADYKANPTWGHLNIVGDATIVGEKAPLGCPTGLYFATKDGKLMYQSTEGVIEDTGIPAGDHAFQLGAAHNRVYVGYAGKRFTYQSPKAGMGDGELFYLNRSGSSFYRVTLVSNIGYDAFEDPFSLSVDAPNHQLLVADRNVGVHKVDTERPGLYGSQPFLLNNNWLPYYGTDITWGAIGCGIERDSEGVYWMGKKFNGNGIFRFMEGAISNPDVAPEEDPAKKVYYPVMLNGVTLTTLTLDEKNGFLYCFLQFDGKHVPGVYRFDIQTMKDKGETVSFDDATLIDASPVLQEGTPPAELTGITQISSNGEYVYWAYIAPTSAEDMFIGKEDEAFPTTFDPTNPLHKSGIKRISAKRNAEVKVEFAVEGVEAYGVAAYVFEGESGVEGNFVDKVQAENAVVKGSTVEVAEAANVRIVALNGAVVAQKQVEAGAVISLEGLAQGMYLVSMEFVDGTTQVVKVVK